MAKTAKKKLNKKMRRSIRRTFACVFMITAIVVAAIPVPGNLASNGEVEALDAEVTPTEPAGLTYPSTPPADMVFTGQIDLIGAGETEYEAQTIQKRSDGTWWMDWQFKFFRKDNKGVIKKYNSDFKSREVTLPFSVTYKYVMVETTVYDAFYQAFEASPATNVKKLTDVTRDGVVSGPASGDAAFFEKYYLDDVNDLKAKYSEYYRKLDATPSGGTPPTRPLDKERKVTELSTEQKYQYYCDVEISSKGYGSDYALVSVIDNRNAVPGQPSNKYIYIPKGGTPSGIYSNDAEGFLREATSPIVAIGVGAFKGVENVDTLTIPEEIGYIGDEAFMNSFLKSIKLENIMNIGNRAFKDCSQLTDVSISSGTVNIGTEAFMNSGIKTLKLPPTVAVIGAGAYANCHQMQSLDLSEITKPNSTIGDYAFYDCIALNEVKVGASSNKAITTIGKAAFAAKSGITGSMTEFTYPSGISTAAALADLTLAGRTNLTKVTMPADYGRNTAAALPKDTLYKCINLEELEFPDDGNGSSGLVTFDKAIFASIIKPDFYVRGPENDLTGTVAAPRKSTWETYSTASLHVPYVYRKDGVDYYEVSDGNYLLLVNEKGELVSCELINRNADNLDLIIPSKVGTYKVTSIAKDCFDDDTKKRLKTITIEDDSISSINNNVFEKCPKLEKVVIGNSVNAIGERAFADCQKLTTVVFNPPKSGNYGDFTIGPEAFATKSADLTFYGDIVDNYEPFVWAVSPDNYMDVTSGKRVCYKSFEYADMEVNLGIVGGAEIWGPKRYVTDNLTVMYDNNAKDVVLLNYPKYNMLDKDNVKYIEDRKAYFIKKYSGDDYKSKKIEYDTAKNNGATQERLDELDGPWNPDYFTRNLYSIVKHYEEGGNNEWETLTPFESELVKNCLEIEVPSGVTSLDVYGFYKGIDNNINWATYINSKLDSAEKNMYTQNDTVKGVVAGLFSGEFKDDENAARAASEIEKEVKGNDYVQKITLNDVAKLPAYAFDSCEALQTVAFGDELTDIGTTPFRGCSSLQNVAGNATYTVENGIIYSKNASGLTIEEGFPTRGNGYVGEAYMNGTSDPKLKEVTEMRESAFENCDFLVSADLTDMTKLREVSKYAFKDCDKLTEVILPKSIKSILEEAFKETSPLVVTVPAKEVNIVTNAFEHDPAIKVVTYDDSAALAYAKHYGLSWAIIGEDLKVTFLDHDMTILGEIQFVKKGGSAIPPTNPVRDGYTFTGWKGEYKNIQEDNTIILAQYKANSSSGGGDNGGGNNGGNSGGNNNGSNSNDDDSESDNSSSSKKYHTVVVIDGSGGGTYKRDSTVTITANGPPTGKKFKRWETSSKNVSLEDATDGTTTFKMPKNDVEVKAVYTGDPVSTSANSASSNTTKPPASNQTNNTPSSGSTGNSSGTTNSGSGSDSSNDDSGSKAVVDTGGISNKDKVSVTVDGSTDNFIVRISDSSDAAAAVERALTKEFGSLDNIRYFPMDISLYDSTGASKIEDTSGLTVNITMPIPDQLTEYAGNNKAGAVVGDDTLEKLNAKFKTIDGVSCISFQATHFSPYTVYVDTSNLSAAMDDSPQTGDGIHPKWFLALGLASLSIVLFMKRDKNTKIKVA